MARRSDSSRPCLPIGPMSVSSETTTSDVEPYRAGFASTITADPIRSSATSRPGSTLSTRSWEPHLALQADDRRDLNRYPERELACPERLAGVAPTLAKDFKDQVAGAVEDLRLLLETRRRADEAAELDELLDLVERSGVLADERHDVQRADLRRPAGVLQTDIAAHHPAELDLAVPAGDDARGIEELADLPLRHVGLERLGATKALETERDQRRLSGIHGQDPSG